MFINLWWFLSFYTIYENKEGRGPAWANSLFEDNAEFGFGMRIASETMRDRIQNIMAENIDKVEDNLKALFQKWLENRNSSIVTREIEKDLIEGIKASANKDVKAILEVKDHIVKRSQWILYDGWAYDIGFGGLDHVLLIMKINILY